MRGKPYQSRDVWHVNPEPDPEDLWEFRVGTVKTIGYSPAVTFEVTEVASVGCTGVVIVGEQRAGGELWLNRPVVVCRKPDSGAPMVTLTLRRVDEGVAFIQVSASPEISQEARQ